MKTITMQIDDGIWSRAEQKAAALATSVDEVVVQYLQQWADDDAIEQARRDMSQRFSAADWRFSVGQPDDRGQRNART